MTKIRTQRCFVVHVCALVLFFASGVYISALAELAQLIDIRFHYHYEDRRYFYSESTGRVREIGDIPSQYQSVLVKMYQVEIVRP